MYRHKLVTRGRIPRGVISRRLRLLKLINFFGDDIAQAGAALTVKLDIRRRGNARVYDEGGLGGVLEVSMWWGSWSPPKYPSYPVPLYSVAPAPDFNPPNL